MNKLWTIGSLLQWTQEYFAQKGVDTPRLDAEILLAHVLQKERIYLYAHYDQPMNPPELAAYREMVKKRAGRLSVAHILGTKAFMGLDFRVTTNVLVPRPETEMLVETMLDAAKSQPPASILDIGTGSGAIILSLLHYLPEAAGTGVDISPQALAVARQNGEALGLADRVTWVESDMCAALPEQPTIILPQSVYFDAGEKGDHLLKKAQAVYRRIEGQPDVHVDNMMYELVVRGSAPGKL